MSEFHIDQKIKDGSDKFYIRLNPNQPLFPGICKPPIVWEGLINQKKIKLTQKERSASSLDDFYFDTYPTEFDELKSTVIKLINTALKTMN